MAENRLQNEGIKTLDWAKSRVQVAFLIKIVVLILYLFLSWHILAMDAHEKHGLPVRKFYGVLALVLGLLSLGLMVGFGVYLGIKKCCRSRNPFMFDQIGLIVTWILWLFFDVVVSNV